MNILCIDPGHGGPDTGRESAIGLSEKDVTLALARKLGNACRAQGWQITMTRIDDRQVATDERATRANRAPATCLISLHACDLGAPGAKGGGLAGVIYQGGKGMGYTLATTVREALVSVGGLPDGDVVAAPRLELLRWCSIPAALVQFGHLGDATGSLLATDQGRQSMADALARALTGLFG